MFKGNKCNPFLVLIAIDSVVICMQQFHKDGMVWLLHGVCSMSCAASLRATHVGTQSGGSIPVLQPQFAPRTKAPGWGKPCGLSTPPSAMPFAQPRFLWREQPRPGELPIPGRFLQGAAASPCRGIRDQGCLCPPSSVCSTQGLGCHQPWVSQVRQGNNRKICWMQQQHTMVMLEGRFSY